MASACVPKVAGTSWGADLNEYRQKKVSVDPRLLEKRPMCIQPGAVRHQERAYDVVKHQFRDEEREARQRQVEHQTLVSSLECAQDKQLFRENFFNIINHKPRSESIAQSIDTCSTKLKPFIEDTNVDYHIVSNLSHDIHHWARPEDRPRPMNLPVQQRKMFPNTVKEFNIISNRYTVDHDRQMQRDQRLSLLGALDTYMQQNRFNPVTQQFSDPQEERNVRICHDAREVERRLQAEELQPPYVKNREAAFYDMITHQPKNENVLVAMDGVEKARKARYKRRYSFERKVHAEDLVEEYIADTQKLNRTAPGRYNYQVLRGHDLITNESFGDTTKNKKQSYEAYSKPRFSTWEKIEMGRSTSLLSPSVSQRPAAVATSHVSRCSVGSRDDSGAFSENEDCITPTRATDASIHRTVFSDDVSEAVPAVSSCGNAARRFEPPPCARPFAADLLRPLAALSRGASRTCTRTHSTKQVCAREEIGTTGGAIPPGYVGAPPPAPEIPGKSMGSVFSHLAQ